VFAKAPVPGRVKTRLGVGPEQAAALHDRFVRATLDLVLRLPAAVELHTDIETAFWSDYQIPRFLQPPGDLGAKMLAALASRPAPVMIVGSDSPDLPLSHLESILASTADVTLGPTEDGGFYAIFCRATHPAMFDGVEWSTSHTREQTLAACAACGFSTALGDQWFDIDTPEDLSRLPVELR